jgi:hypothetical protein
LQEMNAKSRKSDYKLERNHFRTCLFLDDRAEEQVGRNGEGTRHSQRTSAEAEEKRGLQHCAEVFSETEVEQG